jgi:thiamine biosynthesis lipoprotein
VKQVFRPGLTIILAGSVFLLILFWVSPFFFTTTVEQTALIMSTPVTVKVSGVNAPRLARQAMQRMRQLDGRFSRFSPSSEVSLINQLTGKTLLNVSADTLDCLAIAARVKRLSGCAFNVHYSGKIDLGGIGKGYAVEAARRLMLENGAKSGMINMRSSIAVFGNRTWQIGVQHPRQKGVLLGTITLHDGDSLGTSGDYERGKHIIDPATGKPAELCQAVTVIGKDAAETDALSTAIFVLGPSRGLVLIKKFPGFEVLIVDAQGRIFLSSGFKLIKK